jgi:hypothetical protein
MKNYIEFIIKIRFVVVVMILLLTAAAIFNAKNIRIIIDPAKMMPQSHPYVSAGNEIEAMFGSKHTVVIGINPSSGDIYQDKVLSTVAAMTADFLATPGVIKENLLSLAAKRVKDIKGSDDGLAVARILDPDAVKTFNHGDIKQAIARNPIYHNLLVAADEKSTAIVVEFKDEPQGFRAMMEKVHAVTDKYQSDQLHITIGGLPNFLSKVEIFSERMGIFLPVSFVILCVILFIAFRTKQALILPLVTALIAVIWGLGIMGAFGVPMDVFNATTPILILAIATGHAVQLLKRYYEEYQYLTSDTSISPKEANHLAIINSISKMGPVMLTAGIVASLGFLSLIIFEISTVKTFGIFTAIGIGATVLLEMTFIPALRSMMRPPKVLVRAVPEKRVWDKISDSLSALVVHPQRVLIGTALFVIISSIGIGKIIEDNSVKKYFSKNQVFQLEDEKLNASFGGTNTFYILVQGKEDNALKSPSTLEAMDRLQQMLNREKNVGKTLSIVDFIKQMNRAMNGDKQEYYTIPDNEDLISQYFLLYSMSGEPSDFDSFIDYNYKNAKIVVFSKTDSTAFADDLIEKINSFSLNNFDKDVVVKIGGSVPQDSALNHAMVEGKILNIVQIGLVVFIISSLVFRSLIAGILVMTPLVITVIANFGLMGWTGILLNIPTSLTSAMAVGIGADYAIYLIYRLREELQKETDTAIAINRVLSSAGEAIMFVAVAISCGYGVLLFSSGFYIHMWLATLIALAMITSAAAALIIVPTVIIYLRPKFIFGNEKSSSLVGASVASFFMIAIFLVSFNAHKAKADEVDIKALIQKNYFVNRVSGSTSNSIFILINKQGQQRKREVFGVTKLAENGIDNMRFTRFQSPSDVKGTASLLIEHQNTDDDMWIYLPALKKVRRLVSSNKKDSFIGTDFSYADVIGFKTEEWNYKIIGKEVINNADGLVIEATPASSQVGVNTGYSKRKIWLLLDNAVTTKMEFWDLQGEPLKTITFEDIQNVDKENAKWQAMRLMAKNIQTGHSTEIQFQDFKVHSDIDSKYFTARYLERE